MQTLILAIAISACGADSSMEKDGCTIADSPSVRVFLVFAGMNSSICNDPYDSTGVRVIASKDHFTYPLKQEKDSHRECVYVLRAGTGEFQITAQAFDSSVVETQITVQPLMKDGRNCGIETKTATLELTFPACPTRQRFKRLCTPRNPTPYPVSITYSVPAT